MVKDTNDMLHMVQESTLQDAKKRVFFATVVVTENTHQKVNFRKVDEDVASKCRLRTYDTHVFCCEGDERLSNTIYSYFIGKRVAFPVVEKWPPSTSLTKENHSSVPIWVKMHNVPMAAYMDDGYARAMIEVHANVTSTQNIFWLCDGGESRRSWLEVDDGDVGWRRMTALIGMTVGFWGT
nr:hypothetical protein [Tanacetum cinerariifolium]